MSSAKTIRLLKPKTKFLLRLDFGRVEVLALFVLDAGGFEFDAVRGSMFLTVVRVTGSALLGFDLLRGAFFSIELN